MGAWIANNSLVLIDKYIPSRTLMGAWIETDTVKLFRPMR